MPKEEEAKAFCLFYDTGTDLELVAAFATRVARGIWKHLHSFDEFVSLDITWGNVSPRMPYPSIPDRNSV